MTVRVRFAPSPTGPLHIGGVRTALYNYLFARHHNGAFVLRIEDTDQMRYVDGAEDYILSALSWLDIEPDESPRNPGSFGPYRQSERRAIYRAHIDQLVRSGHAYYAFDTPAELEAMRTNMKSEGVAAPKYDASIRMQMRNSLVLSGEEVEALIRNNVPYTVRLKVDPGEEVTLDDRIRGEVSFSSSNLDDKILLKADGMPTYHLANVVDDHLMEITHVIRGEEWLSSTAHHVLLYRAFGWSDQMPEFAHMPLILKPTGKGKLSKRDGAKFGFPVFPLTWKGEGSETFPGFRESGFDPQALLNFLAFLGWNPGTEQEIFSPGDLEKAFSLAQITKSGARFDFKKALWYNAQYIQNKDPEKLDEIVRLVLGSKGIDVEPIFLRAYCNLFRERVSTYEEFYTAGKYFFETPDDFDRKTIRKKWNPAISAHFRELIDILEEQGTWIADDLKELIRAFVERHGLKFGHLFPLIRVAISGMPQGPDLFISLFLLGKMTVLERMRNALVIFDEIKREEDGQTKRE